MKQKRQVKIEERDGYWCLVYQDDLEGRQWVHRQKWDTRTNCRDRVRQWVKAHKWLELVE